jgi:hypothetical protein
MCTGSKPILASAVPAVGVAVDQSSVFFTSSSSPNGGILSCPKTGCGGQPTTLAAGEHNPLMLALDATTVYWTDFNDGTIASCAKAGCNMMPTKIATMQPNPFGIVVDNTNVYWVNTGTMGKPDGSLVYCPKTGCMMPTTLIGSLNTPETVAMDAIALYVATADSIVKIAKP